MALSTNNASRRCLWPLGTVGQVETSLTPATRVSRSLWARSLPESVWPSVPEDWVSYKASREGEGIPKCLRSVSPLWGHSGTLSSKSTSTTPTSRLAEDMRRRSGGHMTRKSLCSSANSRDFHRDLGIPTAKNWYMKPNLPLCPK